MTYSGWYQFKLIVEQSSGISMDALHILVGTAIFLLSAAMIRRSISDWRPMLVLLALEICNEVYDLRVERWPDLGMQLGEGFKDLLLTIAMPLALSIIARLRPDLLAPSAYNRLADDEMPHGT